MVRRRVTARRRAVQLVLTRRTQSLLTTLYKELTPRELAARKYVLERFKDSPKVAYELLDMLGLTHRNDVT